MADDILYEQTYPARVITVDWGLIAIGLFGLVLVSAVVAPPVGRGVWASHNRQ